MDSNETEDICYPQPKSLDQRVAIAKDFVGRFQYELELVVDPMENLAEEAFAAWPERLYVVDDGKIVYKGDVGPFGFKPDEVEQWLAARLGPEVAVGKGL
jgi:type I thyroxine 5'-deiodinase